MFVAGCVVDGYSTDDDSDDNDDNQNKVNDDTDDSLDEESIQRKVEAFNKKQMVRIKKLEGMKILRIFSPWSLQNSIS